MKCLHETVIWLLIPFLVLEKSYAAPAKKTIRNGKYMAFTAEDMFADLLDDVQDPLAVAGTINEKAKFYNMNDTVETSMMRPKFNDTKMTKLPVKTEEKFALYNQDTGKYELITTTSGHFSFPMKPVTENGVFFYGGEHYHYRRPVQQPNKTEEFKIFWSAVGDAVENSPYFPIQLNVPDMISAMTNFLVNYIPFLNRLSNPNHPRLPYPGRNHTDLLLQKQQQLLQQQLQQQQEQQHHNQFQYQHHPLDYYDSYDVYQPPENSISRREFILEAKSKERQKVKRKSNKKKNSQKLKGIFSRPNREPNGELRKTTSAPLEDTKIWHQFGSDTKETIRLKNMPITRKRVRVADREVFNFRNSDISNSPIMILNVPQRPIVHYKISHNEVKEKIEKQDKNQTQIIQPQQQQQVLQQPQLPQQIQLPQIQQLQSQVQQPQVPQKQQAQNTRIRNSLQQTPVKSQKKRQIRKTPQTPGKPPQRQQTATLAPQTPKKPTQQQQIRKPLQQTPVKLQQQNVVKPTKQTKQTKQNRRKTRTNSKAKRQSRRTGRSDSEVNEQTSQS